MQKTSPLVKPDYLGGILSERSEYIPPHKFTRGVIFFKLQKYPPGILFRGDALPHDTGREGFEEI
jgi:hypothetical protein